MLRTIKSFVLRSGRVSVRQKHALEHWASDYIIANTENAPWCLSSIFKREADTVVEIGFGMGRSLAAMAKERPDLNFLGIEVHVAGIGSLVAALHDEHITNVRIAPYDAVQVFKMHIIDSSLAGVQIFFPDPWPKARHHKRRLIQTDFIKILVAKIKIGGFIHCATDWQEYADQMLAVLSALSSLHNQYRGEGFGMRPTNRPLTKFEQRAHNLGHKICDLIFIRDS